MSNQRRFYFGLTFAGLYCAAALYALLAVGVPEPISRPLDVFIFGVVLTAALFSWPAALALWLISIPVAMYFLMPPAGIAIDASGAYRLAFYSVVSLLLIFTVRRARKLAQQIDERAAQMALEQEQGIEQAHDAIIGYDPERRITRWNLGAQELYGWTAEEARGQVVDRLLKTRAAIPIGSIHKKVTIGGRWDGELTHTTRDGREIVVESRHVHVRNRSGKPAGFLEINRDITSSSQSELAQHEAAEQRERLLAEARLRADEMAQNRAQLEAVFHSVSDGIVVFDMHGNAVLVNEAEARISGYPSASEMKRDLAYFARVFEFLDANGSPIPVEEWPVSRALRGESFMDREIRGRRRDTGQEWYFSFSGGPVRDKSGAEVLALIVTRDITDRWRSREALRESEERLRLAIGAANEGIWEWNLVTGRTTYNDTFAKLYGRPEEGLNPRDWWMERIHPDERERVREGFREAISSAAETWTVEYRMLRADGGWSDVCDRAAIARDDEGRATRIAGAVLDQTERKRAEAALRESELRERARAEELEAVLDAIPAPVFIARDPDCRLITGSRATYDFLRLPPGSNISKSAAPGESAANFRPVRDGIDIPPDELPMQRAAATGQPVRNYEFDIVFEDGSTRSLLGDALPLMRGGQVRGAVGVFLDVTDRKRSEERLRQAQKLESIGVLAGGVAHDFNNLLAGILGNASLLEDEIDGQNRAKVQSIIEASERAAGLTRQLLAYAGKGRFIIESVDLSKMVIDMTALLQASIPKKVKLTQELPSDLPRVEADPGQIQQIVMNLLLNAAEAIPENEAGSIIIRTNVREVREHQEIVDEMSGASLAAGTYVCLEISDTGCGMDPATKARIFDPFFTTKFTGRGLGLPALAGVVRSHRGAVEVHTSLGAGATFRVYLPASGAGVVKERTRKEQNLRGHESILVVDDEQFIRDFAYSALRRFGYQVLTASQGEEALVTLGSERNGVDLVLLDLMMPVMGGRDTAAALREVRPNIPIVLMSGYSEAEAARLFTRERPAAFIQKPFSAQQVAEVIRAVLHGSSEQPAKPLP